MQRKIPFGRMHVSKNEQGVWETTCPACPWWGAGSQFWTLFFAFTHIKEQHS